MSKFRRLSLDELKQLEKEFIDFLVINGIVADDWETLKKDSPDKADGIVDAFSDMVFEGVFQEVAFLEMRTSHDIKTFQCLPDKLILVGLKAPKEIAVDFQDETFLQNALIQPPVGLELYTTEKTYHKDRSQELFALTEKGCTITQGKLFKALSLALASRQG